MDTWVLALSEHERPSVYRDQSFSPPPSLKDSCKNIDHVITKFLSLPSTRSCCPWARSCCRRACWRWSSTSSSWGRQSFHLLHLLSTDISSQSVRRTPSSGFLPWCGCFCPSWQNRLLTCCLGWATELFILCRNYFSVLGPYFSNIEFEFLTIRKNICVGFIATKVPSDRWFRQC